MGFWLCGNLSGQSHWEGSDKEYQSAADPYRTDNLPVHYLKGSMSHRTVLILINDLGKVRLVWSTYSNFIIHDCFKRWHCRSYNISLFISLTKFHCTVGYQRWYFVDPQHLSYYFHLFQMLYIYNLYFYIFSITSATIFPITKK